MRRKQEERREKKRERRKKREGKERIKTRREQEENKEKNTHLNQEASGGRQDRNRIDPLRGFEGAMMCQVKAITSREKEKRREMNKER